MAQADSSSSITGVTANSDSDVAKVVVDSGLATRTEVDFCREQQKQSSDPNQRSLADLLVEHSFVTVNQVKRIRGQIDDKSKSSQIPGYRLLGTCGKGAMATVYKAKQISLNRTVAVKVLPKRLSENPEFVDRFYKEGQAAAKLSHNNIVQAIDVGSTPNQHHYFVMEYIEGKTLFDMMAPPPEGDGKAFSEAEALDLMIQMADALLHAHERGLIHRDVKPKNIIVTPGNVAKLTDLGLARALDDTVAAQSEAGKAYGTPYYISPEQIRGDVDIDYRADIYSLGATMYHVVTGRPPFEADTPTAVMHKHLRDPLVPPDHINTALSAGISEIVEVAMAKKRDERYPSMKEMLEDLVSVSRNEPPLHARREVDLEKLAAVAETGKTVDIAPTHSHASANIWGNPAVVGMLIGLGVSVLINLILLIIVLKK